MTNPFDADDEDLADFKDGQRNGMALLIAIWGDSGTGKTRSGMAVSRGLAMLPGEDPTNLETLRQIDQRVYVIDTDAGRAQHYMPAPGEDVRADRFAFKHAPLGPPYTSKRLLAMCNKAVAGGAKVVMIDSFSLFWDGEGGCSDWKERIVDAVVARKLAQHNARQNNRYPFDEDYERDKAGIGAWNKPKVDWRHMERRLLDLGVHLVFCGHADDKLSLEKAKDDQGNELNKTVVIQAKDKPIKDRWVPIAEKKFKRRLTVSVVLTPEAPGLPYMVKDVDPEIAECIPLDRQLNANVGKRLAEWARGQKKKTAAPRSFSLDDTNADGAPSPALREETAGAWPGGAHPDWDALDPAKPIMLPHRPTLATRDAWTPFAVALRALIREAPDDETAQRWRNLNSDFVLKVSAQLAADVDAELVNRSKGAEPEGAGASDGMGSGGAPAKSAAGGDF